MAYEVTALVQYIRNHLIALQRFKGKKHSEVIMQFLSMRYIRYILNIKENKIKIGISIVLYLRQNHFAKTNADI